MRGTFYGVKRKKRCSLNRSPWLCGTHISCIEYTNVRVSWSNVVIGDLQFIQCTAILFVFTHVFLIDSCICSAHGLYCFVVSISLCLEASWVNDKSEIFREAVLDGCVFVKSKSTTSVRLHMWVDSLTEDTRVDCQWKMMDTSFSNEYSAVNDNNSVCQACVRRWLPAHCCYTWDAVTSVNLNISMVR